MMKRHSGSSRQRRTATDRRGSTLLIVLALLGLLTLLGFVFYTFAAQEQANAVHFNEAAKVESAEVDYFEWGLEQLIKGPDNNLRNSALYGGRHSLITNMFGGDLHPYSGVGVNVTRIGSPGVLQIDQNMDGIADPGIQTLLEFNDSPVAWSVAGFQRPDANQIPDPAIDYTYPDINNVFLAYKGFGMDGTNNPLVDASGTNVVPVIIPSFHRPQYLRQNDLPVMDWAINPAMSRRVLRPHPEHVIANSPSGTKRFLNDNDPADAAIISALPGSSGGFPFQVNDDADPVNNEQGVWSASAAGPVTFQYEYDVDNDLDPGGIKEGIWLDLDHPVEELSSGVKYIPMFSFTIYDADALLNLNIHGNLAGDLNLGNPQFGNNDYVSQSNLGMSPGEVNPIWALTADPRGPDEAPATGDEPPAGTFQQHNLFFGHNPVDRREAGNMEWYFNNVGRAELTGPSTVQGMTSGRYGEGNLLYQHIVNGHTGAVPQPGRTGFDDNGNELAGEAANGRPGFGTPLDFVGSGRFTLAGDPKQPLLLTVAGTPVRLPRYNGYHSLGSVQLTGALGGALMPNPSILPNQLIDDPMEILVDPTLANRPWDEIMGPQDLAILQMSDTTAALVNPSNRPRELMPFNFTDPNVRSRFTTTSWDRKQYGMASSGFRRPWEFNNVAGASAGSGGAPPFLFPPKFRDVQRYDTTPDISPKQPEDPFRPQLRRLLEIQRGNINQYKRQMKASFNGVLDVERIPGRPVDLVTGPLEFRPLTPHPANLPATSVTQTNVFPPQTPAQQEWWARKDRQDLCRDIYVLLYTLGGGRDAFNAAMVDNDATAMTAEYDDARLNEMAQFAVNLVDSLDRDDVITHFEFDKNLANGWQVDGDHRTDEGNERGEVHGVERQDLTFSEGLAIMAAQVTNAGTPQDHPATEYNDTANRYFTYMELRCTSPYPVTFTNRNWQIRVKPSDPIVPMMPVTYSSVNERRLTLHELAGNPGLNPGQLFTIGTAGDDTTINTTSTTMDPYSVFKVDPLYDSGDASTPDFADPRSFIAPAGGVLDLDLVSANPANRFRIEDATGNDLTATKGALLNEMTVAGDPSRQVTFELYRRTHPGRLPPMTAAEEADNPWVMVDELTLQDIRRFELQPTDEQPNIASGVATMNDTKLDQLWSTERGDVLNRRTQQQHPRQVKANTLANVNNNSAGGSSWHRHLDREFATVAEILALPIVSPEDLTRDLVEAQKGPRNQNDVSGNLTQLTFGAKVLQPEHPANRFLAPPTAFPPNAGEKDFRLDNRWYRLLSFMDIPTRTHDSLRPQLNNTLNVPYVPGLINFNTIRHPEVLAAVLDDERVFDANYLQPNQYLPSDTGTYPGDNNPLTSRPRDWWAQFLRSRDHQDPTTTFYLPGLPGSRPFRSFSFSGRPTNRVIEDTLLRHLPIDYEDPDPMTELDAELAVIDSNPSADPRHLFELGTPSDHIANTQIDQYTKHRLLGKVLTNATTRSNVFMVWMTVDFFEVQETAAGEVRIGGQLPAATPGRPQRQRAFFVIDRSRAEDAFDTGTSTFRNWRELIEYGVRIN